MVLVLFCPTALHRFRSSFHLELDRTFRLVIPVAETSFHNEDRSGALNLEAIYK
jgi:hypothetical protein